MKVEGTYSCGFPERHPLQNVHTTNVSIKCHWSAHQTLKWALSVFSVYMYTLKEPCKFHTDRLNKQFHNLQTHCKEGTTCFLVDSNLTHNHTIYMYKFGTWPYISFSNAHWAQHVSREYKSSYWIKSRGKHVLQWLQVNYYLVFGVETSSVPFIDTKSMHVYHNDMVLRVLVVGACVSQ